MPRKSIVEEIIEEHPTWEADVQISFSNYLVFYGFNGNPSHRFYKALEKLKETIPFNHPRKGLICTMSISRAYTISRLIAHYGGQIDVVKGSYFDYELVFDKYR